MCIYILNMHIILKRIDVLKRVRYNVYEVKKMNTINITNARTNLFQLVSDVNKGFNPVNIINNKGENAILLSENDWRDIEETIYLNSIPGFVDSIEKAKKDNKEECSVYLKGEEW